MKEDKLSKAEDFYHRYVQYERNDVSDSLKRSILTAMEEYAKAYAPVKSYTKYLIENDKEEWYWIDFSEGMKPLPNKSGDTWTKDASQALQFDTLQEAEAYRKKYNLAYPQFKVTEHEFIAAPVPGKEEMPDDVMKTITVELPQHPKIKGTMNIVSDSFGFNYADIETHHGLQASFDADSIEYKLLLSACINIAKNTRVIEDIHNNKSASPSTASNEDKLTAQEYQKLIQGDFDKSYDEPKAVQAAKEYAKTDWKNMDGEYIIDEEKYNAFLAGASFNSDAVEVHVHGISKQKSDAVEFAEWIEKNDYWADQYEEDGKTRRDSIRWSKTSAFPEYYTTEELYNLFKQKQ